MANFCFHRVEKVTQPGMYGCMKEHNRTPVEAREEDFIGKIDPTKTAQNKYLVKCDRKKLKKTIIDVLNERGISKYRKDAILMLDGVYTASPETLAAMSRDMQVQYFKSCVEFHEKYYGYVINAVIHWDETTPHLHVSSVPVLYDDKKEKWRLTARDLIGSPKHMSILQTKFWEEVGQKYDMDRGILKSITNKKHKTNLQNQVDDLEEEIATKRTKCNELDEMEKDYSRRIAKKMKAMDEANYKFDNLYRNIQTQTQYLIDHAFEMTEAEKAQKKKHILNMEQELNTMDLSDCFER